MDSINWENPPEPDVDGCRLNEGCYRTYRFGPSLYPLSGEPAAFYYPANQFKNLTFTFDPARMDSKGNASTLLSDVLKFYEGVLSTDELGSNTFLNVFPNPVSTRLSVETSMEGELSITLLDLAGVNKATFSMSNQGGNVDRLELNLPELPAGIYFVRIQNDKTALTRRVVIR
jgi:hypothetical protein